jgi:hypothetical protein
MSLIKVVTILLVTTCLVEPICSVYLERTWESVCSILSCQSVFDKCIRNECLGVDECRNCVKNENQNCLRCVDSILNEQFTTFNGTQSIVCDEINGLHKTACNFYCRMNQKENWKCETVGGYPLCNCYESNLITTTLKPNVSVLSNSIQIKSKNVSKYLI